MSLLSIITNMRLRQNQSSPMTIIGNADTGVIQQQALLQDIGDELAERNQWQALNIPATINGDGVTTQFAIPSTWDGMSNGLKFQSTLYPMLPVVGPITNEQMAAFKAFPVTPIQPVWRVIDGYFEFFPAVPLGEVYNYNYYSNAWIKSNANSLISTWAYDTDTSLIDEKVLTSGLEWRWLKAKGLDYAEEFRRYENRLMRADGRQATTREVAMSSKRVTGQAAWPGLIPIYDGSANEGSDFGFN